ncbi:hypothetical protein JXO52_01195 [bacterium]|nr:hypothetical protein [bacterium]
MKKCTLIGILAICAFTGGVTAQEVKILDLHNFRHYHYDERALQLGKTLDLHIEAVGASDRWQENMVAYAWILNAETRQTVWELTADNSERTHSRYTRRADDRITLPQGTYEVYYAVAFGGINTKNYEDFGDFIEDLFSGFSKGGEMNRDADDWGVQVYIDDDDARYAEIVPMRDFADPLVKLCPLGDDEYEKQGFTLTKDTKLRLYAIGEGVDGEMYDYGWITNGRTGETVWEMKFRGTDWAGGAEKNRIADETIPLDKGDYVVSFVTDGSHSYEKWNMMPPKDPRHWGITITAADKSQSLSTFAKEYSPREAGNLIVDLTRAGNNFFDERSFTLLHDAELRVRCLGEMTSGRNFADTGYIMNIDTGERVWEMTRTNTRHAGGAEKNRMFDGLVKLRAGNYKVVYVTDDSHAYRRWNSAAPYDPTAWGITVWGGPGFNDSWVEAYSLKDDPDILVHLVRAFDNDRLRGKFRLDKSADVRIYALGERDGNEMCDYGWIEDADGHIVWEMNVRKSQPAGGAEKNRKFNDVIRLDAGDYYVFYRTDGSHSFEDWNDDPPDDPGNWGITVRLEK